MRGQRGVAGVGIVEAEAGDTGVGRPVGLFLAEDAGEHGEDQVRRVFGVEEWVCAARQAEFAAQVVDGLRPLAADESGEALDGASHAGNGFVGAGQAWVHGQNGRVEGGKKRQRREDVAGPGDSGDFGDDGAGVVEFAYEEQVGAGGGGGCGGQVVVGLAEDWEEEFAEAAFGAFADVVDHLGEEGVFGVEIGADGMEFEAQWDDFRLIERWDGHNGLVSAAFQLKGDGDERVDVAKGADVGEDDAHRWREPPPLSLSYRVGGLLTRRAKTLRIGFWCGFRF